MHIERVPLVRGKISDTPFVIARGKRFLLTYLFCFLYYIRKNGFLQAEISAVSRLQATCRKETQMLIKPVRICVSINPHIIK